MFLPISRYKRSVVIAGVLVILDVLRLKHSVNHAHRALSYLVQDFVVIKTFLEFMSHQGLHSKLSVS